MSSTNTFGNEGKYQPYNTTGGRGIGSEAPTKWYNNQLIDNFDYRLTQRRATPSYGIILFTVADTDGRSEILYQLCQRRDSISFAEFLKDTLETDAIRRMHINLMSKEERKRCLDYYKLNNPQALWDDLWINHKSRIYKNDMRRCCSVFKSNMEKYMDEFTDEKKGQDGNSWGFSKGRKHVYEDELDCALREFEEETTIPKKDVQVLKIKPYKEFYTGTDGKPYSTVYYVAYIPYIPEIQKKVSIDGIRKTYISEEVSNMSWLTYNECLSRLDPHKQDILRDLNKTLLFTKDRKPPTRRYSI